MNIPSLAGMGLLMVLILASVLGVSIAILRNYRTGLRHRDPIDSRIRHLRLNDMLRVMGIDRQLYLHNAPLNQVHAQINSCEKCDAKEACEEFFDPATADFEADSRELENVFCPNRDSLADTAGKYSIGPLTKG